MTLPASPEVTPRWLSVSLACKYASMSDKTLMRHVRSGEIYGAKKGGKWYLDRLSIDDFMRADERKIREKTERILAELGMKGI
jgi:hypothetical protein